MPTFFDLPLELRQKVYGEVVAPEVRVGLDTVTTYTRRYKVEYEFLRYDLSLLLTNRQIHDEADSHFKATEPLVRITLPVSQDIPWFPTVLKGAAAEAFKGHSLQVTIMAPRIIEEALTKPEAWQYQEDFYIRGLEGSRYHVIRAKDLPHFILRCTLGDQPGAVKLLAPAVIRPWIASDTTFVGPEKVSLHLHDPRSTIAPLARVREAYQTPAMQSRLLLPFTEFASRHIHVIPSAQESEPLVNEYGIDLVEVPFDKVTADHGEEPLPDVLQALADGRKLPLDPKGKLARAKRLLAAGDEELEAGSTALAMKTYLSALLAMDVLSKARSYDSPGRLIKARSFEWNVMLDEPIQGAPAEFPQNASPLWSPWYHLGQEGVGQDSNGNWNHAAWERQKLCMIAAAGMTRALHLSGKFFRAMDWAERIIERIRSAHIHRRGLRVSLWVDTGISAQEEAHLDAPGRLALGEMYFRAALMVQNQYETPQDANARAMMETAFLYLAADMDLLGKLIRKHCEEGREYFPAGELARAAAPECFSDI